MPVPIKQAIRVGGYIMKRKFRGDRRYPLVLMLEPLFRCNLDCLGCGKIQHEPEILRKQLTAEECFRAAEECGAPIVSIPGGEPLLHPQIAEIVAGLIFRRRFVYLCTNGLLLEKHLHKFAPSAYLTLSVHLDGLEDTHDRLVAREGVFRKAVSAIAAAKAAGFRVDTNTTVFQGQTPEGLADFFDFLMGIGVDGMTVSPGYSYEKAPDRDHFLKPENTRLFFREVFSIGRRRRGKWRLNHSPFYLDFLEGRIDYECTPWGNPNFSVLGWQRPCYLFSDGYAGTYRELMETTVWENYGRSSGNQKCADCMVHCGYEPTAVADSTRTIPNTIRSVRASLR